MITKGKERHPKSEKDWSILIIGLLIIALLVVQGLLPQKPKARSEFHEIIYCSAETVIDGHFVEDGNQFGNGQTQTDELAKKGKFSSLLNESDKGFFYTLKNPIPGASYKVSVWRRGQEVKHCFLAVKALNGDYYFETNEQIRSDGDFWGQLEIIFTIPRQQTPNDIEIYVYKTKGSQKAYFDEFYLQQYVPPKTISIPEFQADTLNVQVNSSDMLKLENIRKRAYAEGIYIKQDDDFVPARIWDKGKNNKADLRFKGDWLDHLSWKGQSYRIEMKKEVSWKGLQSFSVQRPEVRGYLREWVYHQFLQSEDVLSPAYDFVHFNLNVKDTKIYAYESHFSKNLLEQQNRREGPILKFNEDRFWEGMKRSMSIFNKLAEPVNKNEAYWSSEIEAFKSNRIAKDSTLTTQYEQAKNLLYQYKHNLRSANEIFDVERMAKYVAISDLCLAHHALTWHNQRFYYNPVSNLLEPIGFDGYGEEDPRSYAMKLYTKEMYDDSSQVYEPLRPLFRDPIFLRAYFKNLTRISESDFVTVILAQLEEGLSDREKLFASKKIDYSYDRSEIINKAKIIQREIWPYDNSLQIYTEPYKPDSLKLKLINQHLVPLEVMIPGIIEKNILVFPQSANGEPIYLEVIVGKQVKQLKFSLPGCDQYKISAISPFGIPEDISARQQIINQNPQKGIQYFEDKSVLIDAKNIVIDEPLYIDKGQKLVITAGTNLQFKEQGLILTESPIFLNGTKEEPITIESEDGISGSITVLQANKTSEIHHTRFKNLNTLNYNGWNLTGALTFYESNVNMSNCAFESNHCEDALNIIKSDFYIENCQFENIYGDALDADFCTGTLIGSTFRTTGNDALDFSSGRISIHNCVMIDIGDKAISVGESATLSAKEIEIENATFAVVSKDQSKIYIENVNMLDCKTGFAAYQKKPEFGPADIICSGYTSKDVERLFMIESGSSFTDKH